ncbi:putative late blight resistance protein homolog R1B-13 [Nicotiana sylvestris]|uniref:putative late blight resistance protein homolog R1B-13 n=1 Tax=Nicotiana sylvestris TaxID=4096 RepID=UPI00388C5F14
MFENAMKFLDKGPSKLENLATLSSPYFSSAEDMERIVSKTPNLQKLRCIFDKSWGRGKNGSRFPVLDSLTQLETLKVLFFSIPKMIPSGLNFPLSLKKLSLCNFPLELAGILTIAQLPTLYVLKLQQVDFERNEWEVRDDEFPQLKFLKLENLNLSKWRASDEAFSRLERLVLHRCSYLREIPSRFGDMDYLQHIEVKSCNQSAVDSAMEIRETQVEMLQRCGFKVFIQQ